MKTFKTMTWRVLLIGCIAALVTAGVTAFRNQNQGYDYEASISKLRRIGQALQLYREEWGVKPVAERRTYSDAGLPPTIALPAVLEGYAWSYPGGSELLRVAQPNGVFANMNVHFMQLYGPADREEAEKAAYYRLRGERLPIVADLNMNRGSDLAKNRASRDLKAIVLRLDGSVDVVTFDNVGAWPLLER